MSTVEVVEPERRPRKPKANGALAKADEAPPPAPARAGASLLTVLHAVMTDPTASIERMNQAFDFYQRVEKAQARKAFDAAISAAKADFGKVVKTHLVNREKGGTYKHEDLADIAAAVDPALTANGLSYRFRASSNLNEPITVTCVITHCDGHFEETTLAAGADASGGKNSIQAIGSTLSYLQRYSLRLALGVAAGREDDGGASDEKTSTTITDDQVKKIQDLVKAANANAVKFLAYLSQKAGREISALTEIPASQFDNAVKALEAKQRAGI